MKRSTKLALSLVLAIGIAVPAMAQDNFPDVPANHWAFEALAKMKADGLLVGYPDGLYRGPRPASRYELAVALNAVYSHLKAQMDALQDQIKAITGANPQDIQNLKDQIARLQDQINAMKGWGDDIAALKRASEEFSKELRSLGVDVEAMKKDLGDLQERVSRLEKRKSAVDISGDVNFFMVSSNSGRNDRFGLSEDGRMLGRSGNAHVGIFKDTAFLHEGAFTVAGTNESGPKWKGTFVVSNMLGSGGWGSQSTFSPGTNLYSFIQGDEDVYIQDLTVGFDSRVVGLAFNAEAGRVAYKTSPYMFQRANTQSYFDNERWNDGKYRFDGAILGFNFGPAKVHVWGGNTSNMRSMQGIDLNPVVIANTRTSFTDTEGIFGTYGKAPGVGSGVMGTIDKVAAADASFGLGNNGHVNLGYILLEQEAQIAGAGGTFHDNLMNSGLANRDQVYGGDADFGFGRFKLAGGYHKSGLIDNFRAVNSHDNSAWDAKIKYTADRFNLWGGYREVDNNYYAPGDWGRLGIFQNPGNIRGWQAGAYLDLTKAIRLTASGEWDKGESNTGQTGTLDTSPFDKNTNIRQLMARLDIRLNPNLSIYGAWQDTNFSTLDAGFAGVAGQGGIGGFGSLAGADHADFDWTTIGLGYGLSANAKFNVQYQFSNGGAVDNGGLSLGRFNGGILTSQLTIKF